MAKVPARRRAVDKGTASTSGRNKPPVKMSRAAAQGRARLAKELERQKKRKEEAAANSHAPFRFYVPKGEKGEIIICDEEATFFRYEHNYLGESGKRDQYCACLQESEICPVCKAVPDSKAYFGMYLTVIDCRPYTNRDGVEVPFTRKLMVIKSQQQEKWNRRIDSHIEKYGTLRGACVDIYRSNSETSPATGDDIEFIGHEDLDSAASKKLYVRKYENREGKKIVDILSDVVDYDTIFAEPTVEELEEKFNVAPPAGSDRANQASGRANRRTAEPEGDEDGYESADRDDIPWKEDKQDRPNTGRGRPTRAASKEASKPPVRPTRRKR